MTLSITSLLAVVLYIISGILFGRRLYAGDQTPGSKQLILVLAAGAIILHAPALSHSIFSDQGIDLSFFNAFSLVTWLVAVMLWLSAWARPVENLGIVILPLAGIGLVLQAYFPATHTLLHTTAFGIKLHVITSVLAYSLLSIAALQAIMLAIQDAHLHNKHPGGFVRALPPLKVMEQLLFKMIWAGFILLTLALTSGIIFLQDIFAQHLVHKTSLSIVAWVVFAVLLWGRIQFGWRGKSAIRWTLSGFVVLMLAYFGSKLVLELILGR